MKTKFIKRLDLKRNGVLVEVTLINAIRVGENERREPVYEVWFIKNDELDSIDRRRLLDVLNKSARIDDARPLYETMAEITLGNGTNALDYFHQYVKVLYPSGVIQRPRMGHRANLNPSEYV